jgi:1,2-phenylacetyl-CoA epoxidase PaaB subunit
MANIWVVPKDGKWAVKREKIEKYLKVCETQKEAETYGREVAKKDKVEFILMGENGKIRQKDSYGNDPKTSKG